MQHLWTCLVLIAAAINLAPALGAVAPARMSALYGLDLKDPNLQILMRHRAVLFGLVGGYSAEIRRVILVDVVGIAALAGAGFVHAFWLRTAAS